MAEAGRQIAHATGHRWHPDAAGFAVELANEDGHGLYMLNALLESVRMPSFHQGQPYQLPENYL
jgi:hypothetical protein